MEKIVLDKIEVKGNLIEYHYSVSEAIKHLFKTNVMFLEYERDISSVPVSILSIPFVAVMSGLSWLTDSALFVDEIDRTYYNCYSRVKHAYQELHNDIQLKGVLIPSLFRDNSIDKSQNSLLLFGGGVDCHCSYLQNKDAVSHVCNINGWLDTPEVVDKVDEFDKKETEEFASSRNLNPAHVRSNFAVQFDLDKINKAYQTNYWYSFLHSMAFISIAMPLCYIDGISNILIAASFTKDRADLHCCSFITTDSEVHFAENGNVTHDGFELGRHNKVRLLVEHQKSIGRPYPIHVCSFKDHNCCACEKCFRTIVAIVSEGGNPADFGFPIEGNLLEHWQKIFHERAGLWDLESEDSLAYYFTRQRMRENYDRIEYKDFVDWFLNLDVKKEKRDGLLRYVRKNFFSIIKRRLRSYLSK